MKKFVLIVSCFVFSCSMLFAQTLKTKEVPKEVINQFKKINPEAKSVTWQKDGDNFAALFKDDKNEAKSYFTASGEWIKSMFFVVKEDLPTNIINYVKKTYPSFTDMKEMYLLKQKGDKDAYFVDVLLTSQKIIVTIKFTATGRFISEQKKDMPESLVNEASAAKAKSKPNDDNKTEIEKKGKKPQATEPDLIAQEKLPPLVVKTFKKKFMNASEIKWYLKSEDTVYRVTCIIKEAKTEGNITKSGIWINTMTEIDPKSLVSAIIKSIDEFYSNYEIRAAWLDLRADKQNQTIVDIIEEGNKKTGRITKMFFDKSAAIIKIMDVEVEEKEDVKSNNQKSKEEEEFLKEEAKIEKEFKKDQKMKYQETRIDESELPSGVGVWIAQDYPEYIVKKAEFKVFPEFPNYGNIYKVLIQRPGVNQPYATGYFTLDGKLIQVVDTFLKEESQDGASVNQSAKDGDTKKPTTPKAAPKKEAPKREVSKNVVQAFKKQYSGTSDVVWKEGDNRTWIAYFDEDGLNKEAVYSENAAWIETRTKINQELKIPASIRTAIAKNYAGMEIQSCTMILRPEEKPYYTITLYDKKTKSSNDYDFSSTGKLME